MIMRLQNWLRENNNTFVVAYDLKSLIKLPHRAAQYLYVFLFLLIGGCSVVPRYNSLDLALLPCESGDSPIFFHAVEFNKNGFPQYQNQIQDLHSRFQEYSKTPIPTPVRHLVIFVHGWNKNASSAELDYQNFLCRLHGRLRNFIEEDKENKGLVVLGIFWPSTITNRSEEPFLLKPISYYPIRDRADMVAEEGFAKLMADLGVLMERQKLDAPVRLSLIGHSFGGRMMIKSLQKLNHEGKLEDFLTAAQSVNIALINAAISPTDFEWISDKVAVARAKKARAQHDAVPASYLFNIHSLNDSANRVLFPLASLFNDDPSMCAAGACGVPCYPTMWVDTSGKLQLDPPPESGKREVDYRINAWNVDATRIVFDHSDIYKGRVAALLADLLYKEEVRQRFPERSIDKNLCHQKIDANLIR